MARIGIIGAGVVGGATGRGFLRWGHDVVFCDTHERTRQELRAAGLEAYSPAEFRKVATDLTMVSVPTPTVDRRMNLAYVRAAAAELGVRLREQRPGHTVVVRSTLPPGTTDLVIVPILADQSGLVPGRDFFTAFNPEFLREVSAEEDFLSPWLTVVGAPDELTRRTVIALYEHRVPADSIVQVDVPTAEMIKYTSNIFNATKISFANEMWQVSRSLGLDADVVMGAVSRSAEGMWNRLYGTRGGFSYGGACLPKDTLAFYAFARGLGLSMELLGSVISVNERLAELERLRERDIPLEHLAAAGPVYVSNGHNGAHEGSPVHHNGSVPQRISA